MAVKTLTITEDAYQRLASLKKTDESFSELIRRLVPRQPISDLIGALDAQEGAAMAASMTRTRRELDASAGRVAKGLRP
ncbi:MAG: antitoxin VapB family protein [Thermoplasmatota archaeon]